MMRRTTSMRGAASARLPSTGMTSTTSATPVAVSQRVISVKVSPS